MEQQEAPAPSIDETLSTSVQLVKSSRDLIDEIDQRLARGAELLQPDGVIDLRTPRHRR